MKIIASNSRVEKLSSAKRALLALRALESLGDTVANRQETIPRCPRADGVLAFPVSFAQERLWFLEQLEPGSVAYNMTEALQIKGPLQVEAVERAVRDIVRRHEVLRTRFEARNGAPVQVIDVDRVMQFETINLEGWDGEEQERRSKELVNEEAGTAFNLATGPLLRMKMVRLGERRHVLFLAMHHVISDGWSMGVLVREFMELYAAFAAGRPSPLPELPIQYVDYAVWQRQWLQGEVLAKQLGYWRKKLAATPVLELPTDRPRSTTPSSQGASEPVVINRELLAGLKELSRRQGATLFMALLAAFKALLSRYSGQEDIVVGTPIANRNRAETEGLIGFFMNTLVLRTDTSGDPTFLELLERERQVAMEAYEHQDVPFERLVAELQVERDVTRNPLFQVMFVLQNTPRKALSLEGLEFEAVEVEQRTAKFDLLLSLNETEAGISGRIEYRTDLFDGATIRRWIGHWERLLAEVVLNPESKLSALEILSPEERRQLLEEWNDTRGEYSKDRCIHQFFEEQAERTPQSVALVFEDERLTYRELNERANHLAHHLRKLGVGPGVLVGICLERSLEMVIGLLGILKSGGAYVPLDPAYPKTRLAYIAKAAGLKLVLTRRALLDVLPETTGQILCVEDIEPIEGESLAPASPANLAYVLYTSGSTGEPKGVAIEHRNTAALIAWAKSMFTPEELNGVLASTSICFDLSVFEIFVPLAYGGKVILADNALALPSLPAANEVRLINTVPSAMLELLRVGAVPKSVRVVNLAGEPLATPLVNQIYSETSVQKVHDLYGPTETTTYSTFTLRRTNEPATIGRPLANEQVYILDSQMQLAPVGVPGDLYIGGAGVARGYMNRDDLTAERFMPNPFSRAGGERLYRTGDRGRYRTDGNIEFLGRRDDQVKIRGFRIELGEIEARLAAHPMVKASAVLAREDEPGQKRLVGYVVLKEAGPTSAELRNHVKERLPEYMVPSSIVLLDRLPLTANGKVDRKSLPAPESDGGDTKQYVAPRNGVEELLAGIFQRVLRVKRVGIHDNFFELGGHSLLATQLISRVREVLGVDLPLRGLFEAPTVEAMGEKVEAARLAGRGLTAPPIVRTKREGALPLSYAQERLWFLDQMEPGSVAYNIPGVIRLKGRLQRSALEWAFGEVVRRHDALRTRFEEREGVAVQVIETDRAWKLETIDLEELSEEEKQKQIEELAKNEGGRPFELSKGPLVRVRLARLGEEDHVLFFTLHHIVADGWSLGILVREMGQLYGAYASAQPSRLPELPIQYADFAVWQRGWLQGQVLEEQLNYWKRCLRDVPVLELPTDRARPSVQSYNGASERAVISKELLDGLNELGQREGVTLFMTLTAVFRVLLSRYSGQEDIVIGTPIANRNRAETEELIGFFVNTLVLRTDMSGDPTFLELLKRERQVAMEAYEHQDLPFERLVAELQVERDLTRNPLFQVMFVLQNTPKKALNLEGLEFEAVEVEQRTAKFDLLLSLNETEAGLSGGIEYRTDLFDGATIRRWIGHWARLLTEVVSHPESKLSALEILSQEERRQLLEEWNDTAVEYPKNKCVHELFEEQVERTPDAVAVVFDGEQLSYRDLNERANQLAHYLKGKGVGPEVRVGICLERSLEMVVGLLGILKAGGAYVPLDADYPADRLKYMVENSQAAVLLTQTDSIHGMSDFDVETVCFEQDEEKIRRESKTNPAHQTRAENLAYVLFTSGSTGRPKGVMIGHQAVLNFLEWMKLEPGMSAEDKMLAVTTLSFDIAGLEIWLPLTIGASVELAGRDEVKDGTRLAELLEESGASVMQGTPATWRLLLEGGWKGGGRLKALCGGEAWPKELAEQLARQGAEVWNMYGPTETTIWSAVNQVESGQAPKIGRPIANTQFYILDGRMRLEAVGVWGELYIGGEGLARGYAGRGDLTAEKFLPNPFGREAGERMYRTGDVCRYLADGNIEFLGRRDDQVKIRGFRIELGEIEARLAEHPMVKASAVLAREDEPGQKRLVGYVVLKEAGPTSAELRNHVKERLPEYMVPSAVVLLDRLPLTANGKVDRKSLPVPESDGGDTKQYVAPRNGVEELLAGIFQRVLKVKRVGIHDNFFELGGHSLLATQLISRAREALEVDLPLRGLFEAPTVEAMGEKVEAARLAGGGLTAPPIVRTKREGALPLSYAQERLWFIDQLQPNSAAYNMPGVLWITGELSVEALGKAIGEIIARHEILRTTFEMQGNRLVQVIHPESRVKLEIEELPTISREDVESKIHELEAAEVQKPFDLARGPLIRVKLVRLTEADYGLFYTMHHIVSDGWSMGVLAKELGRLYEAFLSTQPSPLPALPVQYGDYAVWQRQWLQGDVLEKQLGYWRDQLKDLPEALELPADRPRSRVPGHQGAAATRMLSQELSQGLKNLGQQHGATLFMTLLAGWKTLLFRRTRQEDVVVGTPIANRSRGETEDLIGFFMNTLVLRTDLSGNPTFLELLKRERNVSLDAYEHQDIPFEQLVQELQPERDLSRNPLFQVFFNLINLEEQTVEIRDLQFRTRGSQTVSAKFDLTLYASEVGEQLKLELVYKADLFAERSMGEFLSQLECLLEQIVLSPEKRIDTYSLVTPGFRALAPDPAAALAEPAQELVVDSIVSWAGKTPNACALSQGDRTWSYGQLQSCARKIAQSLGRAGFRQGDVVAITGVRSFGLIASMIAVLDARGILLTLDDQLPANRRRLMLCEARASGLICVGSSADAKGQYADLPGLKILCVDPNTGEWELPTEEREREEVEKTRPEDSAYIFFTSGTTGVPKAVLGCHKGLSHFLKWQRETFGVGPGDRTAQLTGLSFDVVLRDIFLALTSGATLCLPPTEEIAPEEVLSWMARERITLLHTVPTLAQFWLESRSPGLTLPGLRLVFFAGEPLSGVLVGRWRELISAEGQIVNLYGPTETTLAKCFYVVPTCPLPGAQPLGNPLPQTQVLVMGKGGQICGMGEPGELVIRTPFRSLGYANAREENDRRFLKNPFREDDRDLIYYTGDLGRYSFDGSLEILGRLDDQVKIRGIRIELNEIVAALLQHPAVKSCAVIDRKDDHQVDLIVYVVASQWDEKTVSELKDHLRQQLPPALIPAWFVQMDSLPRTANGKVDRKALPAPPDRKAEVTEHVEPRNESEQLIGNVWKEVLQLERIGIYDNFFELGGHSLLATSVISRVRELFQAELPLKALFDAPTVAGLAERLKMVLQTKQGLNAPPILPAMRHTELPLSFAQERLWFLDQLSPGDTSYNIAGALRIEGVIHLEVLEKTLNEIFRRHEVLRTTFGAVEGRPIQMVQPFHWIKMPVIDLEHLSEQDQLAKVMRLAEEEAQRSFDLKKDLMFRFELLRLNETTHVMLSTFHHIASDGWSITLFVREFVELYKAFVENKESPLPRLPVQYADFAVWQREWLRGEVLENHLSYWKNQLGERPEPRQLPTDRPRVSGRRSRMAVQSVLIPATLVAQLNRLSQREGVTLFMTLLAAFEALLARYSQHEEITVGTLVANRNRSEVEQLIGFFINILTLRNDFSGDPDFKEMLARVRTVALEAYVHQDVPFQNVVAELQTERTVTFNPLYKVMFLLHNTPIAELQIPGITLSPMPVDWKTANLDLLLAVWETKDGLAGKMEYDAELFDGQTIALLEKNFRGILEQVAGDAGRKLSELQLTDGLVDKIKTQQATEMPTIVLAATFTANSLEEPLKFWMSELDISTGIQWAPYNQVLQQLLDPSSLQNRNRLGINVVLVRIEDLQRFKVGEAREIREHVLELAAAVKETAGRSPCSYIVGICPVSPATERRAFFEEMETLLASELQGIRNLCLIRSPEWRQMYPVTEFYDRHGDELGHIPYTAEFFTAMGTMLARKCFGFLTASYKVIVLDCDQTLWGGICAEDGVMGITIDAGRQALQRFMLDQKGAGKLLCLCSKNNEADVAEVFDSRSEMCLKRDDIVAWRINWKSKSENLKSLAEELGLSLHDFIFMDDNPVECAEVEANCPEVLVLKVPSQPEAINEFLRHVWVFDHRETTEEDRNRTELYRANSERERVRKAAPTFEAFLTGLELSLEMKEPGPQQLARVAQLTQRTNQFNTTSFRRSEAELEGLLRTRQLECIVVSASDRFGEYGLIGAMLFKAVPRAINIDTFLLSCRVLGKGIEHRMLSKMCEIACERELKFVEIEYRPTGRNQPALSFFTSLDGQSVKQGADSHAFQLVARDFVSLCYSPAEPRAIQPAALIDKGEFPAKRPRSDTLTRIATELSQISEIQTAVETCRRQSRVESVRECILPQTPYEKTLAEMWSKLLGVEPIGIFDDFFDLGGHSLLATQLISHVREAFQVEIPLQIIFAPRFTIADLVKIIIQSQMEKIDDKEIAALLNEISNTSNEEGKAAIPHAT